jgi:2'-5' RNA ligase
VRAFVAVVPPPAALATAGEAVNALRGTYAGVTWVPVERMHLTLAFLGDVTDDVAARVGSGLAEAVRDVLPFALRVEGGGAFPRAARPNVLWAGVTGDVDALDALARKAFRVARAAGVAMERTPYVPHLTVARVRRRDLDGSAAVAALDAVRGEPWQVTEAVLMRSHLGPKPSYEPLARAPLGYQA